MRGSEALVRMLEQVGVEVVFGLCGDTSLPLYEAFYELKPKIRHVLTRDERSASYMADAYARFSGRVGVCEGPSGGGATYIIPGVAEANQSSVPLVVFTSDINQENRGKGTLTEMDQNALFRPITRYAHTPSTSRDLPDTLRKAFRTATAGGLGAAHVGLPVDVQEGEVPEERVWIDSRYGRYPADRVGPEGERVKRVAGLLLESRKPVIVSGAGVIRSEAWNEVERLAALLGCPVATSISGKGSISETHPYALGVIGSNGGLPYRHVLVRDADLVFFVGCHTGSVTTEKWTLPEPGKTRVVQLDVNPARIGLNYRVEEGIVADAKLGLAALADEIADRLGGKTAGKTDPETISRNRQSYLSSIEEFHSDALPIRPERFLTELFAVLPQDPLVVVDPGTPTPYFSAYYRVPRAGRWFVAPRAHGALGYALPAVVGAWHARPGHKVIGVMGDGSYGISAGELETIARLNLPVVIVVLANACYGWIKAGQRMRGARYFGVDFSATDHARVAEAYGVQAARVEDPRDLKPALSRAMQSPGPFLVDVVIQPLHEARAPVSKWIA